MKIRSAPSCVNISITPKKTPCSPYQGSSSSYGTDYIYKFCVDFLCIDWFVPSFSLNKSIIASLKKALASIIGFDFQLKKCSWEDWYMLDGNLLSLSLFYLFDMHFIYNRHIFVSYVHARTYNHYHGMVMVYSHAATI